MPNPLYLTTPQLTAAVMKLDGEELPARTLAYWAATNLLVPGVDWQHKRRATRLYTLRDLAKARLIVQLRSKGISVPRVRVILAELEARQDLRELLQADSKAWLIVDGYRVTVQLHGEPARDLPSHQLRLPLIGVVRRNVEVAREVRRRAAA